MMAVGRKGAVEQITRAELQIKALAFRKGGASYRSIADHLGIAVATAHEYVAAGLAELAQQQQAEAQELRTLEAARLDDLQAAIWQQARSGNLKAVQTALRIMERRARLLGLDLQPGAILPGDIDIILRWHDDRNIIDITPAVDRDAAAAPQIAEPCSEASGALQGRVLWETMGQEPTGGDALDQDSD
jgi:hypothetical protein